MENVVFSITTDAVSFFNKSLFDNKVAKARDRWLEKGYELSISEILDMYGVDHKGLEIPDINYFYTEFRRLFTASFADSGYLLLEFMTDEEHDKVRSKEYWSGLLHQTKQKEELL